MTTFETLMNQFNTLSDNEKIAAHNQYCESHNYPDNIIYSMDEFEEITCGIERYELLRMAFYGNFNPNDEWFGFNGYGNLVSFGYAEQLEEYICESDIVRDALANPDDYNMFDFEDEEL